MDSEELLAQLADIHLPEPVGLWPPAPGWWVLAFALLALAWYGIRQYRQYRRLHKVCQHALAELERCESRLAAAPADALDAAKLRYLNEVNSVIRRVALVHYPQASIASLDGSAWVDFIREKGESSGMTDQIAAALSYGRFQKRCDVDVDALGRFGRQWVTSLYLHRQTRSPAQGLSH